MQPVTRAVIERCDEYLFIARVNLTKILEEIEAAEDNTLVHLWDHIHDAGTHIAQAVTEIEDLKATP